MSIKTAVLAALGFLCFIIILQNRGAVAFTFLFWSFSISRVFLIPLLVMLGLISGYILGRRT